MKDVNREVIDLMDELENIESKILKCKDKDIIMLDKYASRVLKAVKEKAEKECGMKTSYDTDKLYKELGLSPAADFIDHPRKLRDSGKTFLLSSNYHLDLHHLKQIVELCEKNNANVRIDGDSAYYPGRTMRVVFYKFKDKKTGDTEYVAAASTPTAEEESNGE